MCDVTLLRSTPTPNPAEEGAFPQSRGLEGTPHSCRPLPPHFSTLACKWVRLKYVLRELADNEYIDRHPAVFRIETFND